MINQKKILKFKWLCFIAVILTPSIILLLSMILSYVIGPGKNSLLFLYIITILFISIIVLKKPCSLFSLPIGFVIAMITGPVWLFLLGVNNSNNFGGVSLSIFILTAFFALPFFIITLIIVIVNVANKNNINQNNNEKA